MHLKHGLITGTVSLMLVALAACGTSSGSGAGDAAGPTIELGSIVSGLVPGNEADTKAGVDAAVKAINAKGGIKGAKLNVTYCDDKEGPNGAAACASKFSKDDKTTAVVSNITNYGDSANPLLERGNLPSVNPIMYTGSDFSSPMVFAADGGAVASADAGGPICFNDLKGRSMSLAYIDANSGAQLLQIFNGYVLKPYGKQLTTSVPIPLTAADLSSQTARLVADNADCTELAVGGASATQLIKALRQQGYKGHIIISGFALSPQSAMAALGQDGVRDVVLTQVYDLDSPLAKGYDADMAAAGSDAKKVTAFAFRGWLAVQILADAAGKATSTDRAGILKSLQTLSFDTQGALAGPLNFGDRKPSAEVLNGTAPNILYPTAMGVQISDGVGTKITGNWQNAFKGPNQ